MKRQVHIHPLSSDVRFLSLGIGFRREATTLHPPLSCLHDGLGGQLPRAVTGTLQAQRQPGVKARLLNLGHDLPCLVS